MRIFFLYILSKLKGGRYSFQKVLYVVNVKIYSRYLKFKLNCQFNIVIIKGTQNNKLLKFKYGYISKLYLG